MKILSQLPKYLLILHSKMLTWLMVLAFLVAGSQAAIIRVVNGTDARQGEFPFAASLRRNLRHTCGATILNEWSVLTAAHCVCDDFGRPGDPAPLTIQYGSIYISETSERSVQVARITCHNFSMETLTNDAAVLELATPIPLYEDWEPVKLARNFHTSQRQLGVIIGWGRLWENGPIPSILQKLYVEVYTDVVCGRRFDVEQHVCFGAPLGGACNGDSGTSLLVDGEQAGIASFITTTCGTANENFPNVYAKITAVLEFIDHHTKH